MNASAAVNSMVSCGRPVRLEEVLERAALQERTDTKYVVDARVFEQWAQQMTGELDVLDIDGRREFRYESTYFDTPDRALFRAHRQGRRRRYKVRTRSYLDSFECQLEVKLDATRGVTLKKRSPHPLPERDQLTPAAIREVAAVLDEQHRRPPGPLVSSLTNTYRRSTLLLRHTPVRITCDTRLSWSDPRCTITTPDRFVLVEVKSRHPRNAATETFGRVGARPISVSKYCVGIALLEPWLHANPWRAVIDRYFHDCTTTWHHPQWQGTEHAFARTQPPTPTTTAPFPTPRIALSTH